MSNPFEDVKRFMQIAGQKFDDEQACKQIEYVLEEAAEGVAVFNKYLSCQISNVAQHIKGLSAHSVKSLEITQEDKKELLDAAHDIRAKFHKYKADLKRQRDTAAIRLSWLGVRMRTQSSDID